MSKITIFLYEWKHFIRSPFKIVALLLFAMAAIYGLHNGASLYDKRKAEIEKIATKANIQKEKVRKYFEAGQKGPKNRPWVDVTTPFWAMWSTPYYCYKMPSTTLVYNIGQAEQYGFYKKVNIWSSPYDADMTEEIANPERLQSGTLDFSFVILYLLPLLLVILLYNVKGAEADGGFLALIYVQTGSKNKWLLSRVIFYGVLVFSVLFLLTLYGAMLTSVFDTEGGTFGVLLIYLFLYLLFWLALYFFIIKKGHHTLSNTLKMVGFWLLFAFIIPAAVHQWVSIQYPTNLMTDLIDLKREGREQILEQKEELTQQQLNALYPQIATSIVAQDSERISRARRSSSSALVNELMKEGIALIEQKNKDKNSIIQWSYLFNPITFFQNQLNTLSQTHYQDYQDYRNDIQTLITKQNEMLVLDIWNDIRVDEERYLEYEKAFQ